MRTVAFLGLVSQAEEEKIKYFVVQEIGSLLLFYGLMLGVTSSFLVLLFFVKAGLPPLHS